MSLNKAENLLVCADVYGTLADAEADYDAVKDLNAVDVIGTFDAAVVTKDEDGKVKVAHRTEKPTQHGGWGGLAVGAAIGAIFPQASSPARPSVLASAPSAAT